MSFLLAYVSCVELSMDDCLFISGGCHMHTMSCT